MLLCFKITGVLTASKNASLEDEGGDNGAGVSILTE